MKNLKNNRFFHTLIWKTGGSSTSDINFMSFHEWSEAERVERQNNISITTGRSGDVPYQPIKVHISSETTFVFTYTHLCMVFIDRYIIYISGIIVHYVIVRDYEM